MAALTFAGFGAIAPPSARDEGARSLYAARFALLPLPASARELESAAAALRGPARLSLGSEATEATLAALGPGGARVLHFATHAVLEERLSSGAVLFLAPDADHDGLVSAGEIVELQLGSDLVVLAACRSGLGTAVDGRALSSLPGAFLAAGAGGVVASLWEVGDAASAALMSQFYFELGRGARPAQALATAKRRLRADPRWADPSHWAAWILVGDPPPVVTGWRHRLPWIGVALFAALALGAWIYSRAGSTRSSEASEAAITRPDAS